MPPAGQNFPLSGFTVPGHLEAMKIYTRGGDKGETGLLGGVRANKDDPRIEAYGTVDELSAALGLADGLDPRGELAGSLHEIQGDLFRVGAILATPQPESASAAPWDPDAVTRLEAWIDRLEGDLPALGTFILPGGCPAGAALHLARTVCRRAERRVVSLGRGLNVPQEIVVYLNRLSDYLFVAARWTNRRAGASEEAWHSD